MTSTAPPSSESQPTRLALLISDLRPHPERWRFAARVALSGMIIIAVEMTLRFEILYPAMSAMLITTELKASGTVTRYLLNVLATTIGCAAAVALGSLFIQQPWFLLPVMWVCIIGIIYFMGASRYRGAFFVAGYPFIIIVFSMFFAKGDAEHIGTIVYRAVFLGISVSAFVTIVLMPIDPIKNLRENLSVGFKRTEDLIDEVVDHLKGVQILDFAGLVPDYYRSNTTASIQLVEQAETDQSFGDTENRHLVSLIAFERRCAAALYLVAERVATKPVDEIPQAIAALATLKADLARNTSALGNALESESQLVQEDSHPNQAVNLALAAWYLPVQRLSAEAPEVQAWIRTLVKLERHADLGRVLMGNIKYGISRIFRLSLFRPDIGVLKHATKCSTSILICALFCITINWSTGIGCVETVMFVVQATFGGTLMVGGLRFVGVLVGFTLAIFAVIFIMPMITTLPGFLLLFGPILLIAGYGMHGPTRVNVPAIQMMIFFDFALLQMVGPNISLLPTMHFGLAVTMGIVVTFLVYRFLWPSRAENLLRPCLVNMLEGTAESLRSLARGGLAASTVRLSHVNLDDQFSKFMTMQHASQFETYYPMSVVGARLRAIHLVDQLCDKLLVDIAEECEHPPMSSETAILVDAYAESLHRCALLVDGKPGSDAIPLPQIAVAPGSFGEHVQKSAIELQSLRELLAELAQVKTIIASPLWLSHRRPSVAT